MPVPFEQRSFPVERPCRYLLEAPASRTGEELLVLTLHGYGMRPETMLRLTRPLFERPVILAALEGPNSHYLQARPGGEIGYNWGTQETAGFHWEMHQRMLLTLLPELWREFELGPQQTILAGFSQPVGMNYRFAGSYPGHVRGIIGLCGGVPKDWEDGPYHPVDAALLHISRSEDEFFPVETVQKFAPRLRRHAHDVEFHLLPGPHRFPSQAKPIVTAWLNRVLSPAP